MGAGRMGGRVSLRTLCLGIGGASLLFAGFARADMPPSAPDLSKAASAKVDALIAQTKQKGDLPRLIIPTEAAVLNAFWDTRTMLGAPPYKGKDLGALSDMLEKRNGLMSTYIGFTPNGVQEADADRNLSVFQDEIYRSMGFLLRNAGAVMTSLADLVGKKKPADLNEKGRGGVMQVKSGCMQLVNSAIQTLPHPGLKPENQALVVNALADNASVFATYTSPTDRATLAETARGMLSYLQPDMKARLQTFIDAMGTKSCESLCAFE